MLEKDLEEKCRKSAERAGGKLIKFVSPGNKGVPDRILLLQAVAVFLEFKKPGQRKSKMQPLQDWWATYLCDRAIPYYRVENLAHFHRILKAYVNYYDPP